MSDVSNSIASDARFEAFLFTEIGEQNNGMPITMISALTRLGLDPWDEVRRLATLPAAGASAAIAALAARMTEFKVRASDLAKLPDRLVPLLARAEPAVASAKAPATAWWNIDRRWVLAATVVAIIVAVARQLYGG